MANPVNGKLSSRIMNMKFMKKAEQVEQEQHQVEEVKKLKNSAEWSLGHTGLKQKIKTVQRPVALGASAILGITSATTGRKTFGKPKKEEPAQMQELEPSIDNNKNNKPNEEKDLDELFKDSMSKKRTKSSNDGSKKNKKQKKSK